MSEDLDFEPYTGAEEERTHFAFGPGEAWGLRARVLAVRPRGEQVEITAVGEDARVHEADRSARTATRRTGPPAAAAHAPARAAHRGVAASEKPK